MLYQLGFLKLIFILMILNLYGNAHAQSTEEKRTIPNIKEDSLPECAKPSDKRYFNIWYKRDHPEWKPEAQADLANPKYHTYEVTRYPDCRPTQKHYEKAWQLYKKTFQAAKKNGWFNFPKAVGYGFDETTDTTHYYKHKYYHDGRVLDPERPESLLFFRHPVTGERFLAGIMYWIENLKTQGPQIGGPLTVWHHHPYPDGYKACLKQRIAWNKSDPTGRSSPATAGDFVKNINCPDGAPKKHRGPEMMHVWLAPHPEGPFGYGNGNFITDEEKIEMAKQNQTMMKRETFMKYAKSSFRKYFLDQKYLETPETEKNSKKP